MSVTFDLKAQIAEEESIFALHKAKAEKHIALRDAAGQRLSVLRGYATKYSAPGQQQGEFSALSKDNETSGRRGGRAVSDKWTQIMGFINESGNVLASDVIKYVNDNGLGISGSQVRWQLNAYAKIKQWLEETGGIYALTPLGMEKFDLKDPRAS